MKTYQIIVSLAICLLIVSCGGNKQGSSKTSDSVAAVSAIQPAEQMAAIKKYPIKSAIVTFANEGMGVEQKTILYFDDYGAKEAIEKYDGDAVSEIDLCDGQTRYKIVMAKKIALSSGNCGRGVAYKFDWNEVSKGDKKYKPTKLGNRNVAGKDCEAFSLETGMGPTTYAGWKNICLSLETKSQYGPITMKALKVEDNVTISAEKFQVPKGFTMKKGM
jgi:hypothetical protein